MWMTNPTSCPICGNKDMVYPFGPLASPILIIGDAPGSEELLQGRPFCGDTGYVLRTELGLAGLDLMQMRITNLWQHAPNKNEDCILAGAESAIREAKDRKVILLIGSDPVKFFCSVSVKEYNGLVVVSQYFSAPCVISIQPTNVFKSTVGEVRFAIRQFAKFLKENNI